MIIANSRHLSHPLIREAPRQMMDLRVLASSLLDRFVGKASTGFLIDPRTGDHPRFDHDEYLMALEGYAQQYRVIPETHQIQTWLRLVAHLLSHAEVFIGVFRDASGSDCVIDILVSVRGGRHAADIGEVCGLAGLIHAASNLVIPLAHRHAA